MSEPATIVCMPWEHRSGLIENDRVPCADCGRDVAIDKKVRAEIPDGQPTCWECIVAKDPDALPELPTAVRRLAAARYGEDPGRHPGITMREFARRLRR